MSTIHFEAKLFTINSWIILRLPERASAIDAEAADCYAVYHA